MKIFLLNSRFKMALYVIVFTFLPLSFSFANELRIGLSLKKKHCAVLEKRLNRELKTELVHSKYKRVSVVSIFGYDKKRSALLNNRIDIMESGFGLFYEINKFSQVKYDVLLHACYYKNNINPFYSRGIIFSRKEDNLSLKDISLCKKIFAVNPSSSSGYYIQKTYLQQSKLKFVPPTFVGRHREVREYVEKEKGSIGFCGSFVKLDPKKFKVLYRSTPVPAAIIFSRTSIDKKLTTLLSSQIRRFYLLIFRSAKNHINRFFIPKEDKDYSKFFQLLQTKKSWLSWEWILIIILIIIIILGIIWLINHSNKMKHLQKSEELLLENMKKKRLGFDKDNLWYNSIKKAIEEKNQGHYRHSITEATSILLELNYGNKNTFMKILLLRINNLGINELKMKISGESNKMIGQFSAIVCDRVKHAKVYNDIPELTTNENFNKLVCISDIDGFLNSIKTYRNFAVHDHVEFMTENAAELIIKTILFIHAKLFQSGLFPYAMPEDSTKI